MLIQKWESRRKKLSVLFSTIACWTRGSKSSRAFANKWRCQDAILLAVQVRVQFKPINKVASRCQKWRSERKPLQVVASILIASRHPLKRSRSATPKWQSHLGSLTRPGRSARCLCRHRWKVYHHSLCPWRVCLNSNPWKANHHSREASSAICASLQR